MPTVDPSGHVCVLGVVAQADSATVATMISARFFIHLSFVGSDGHSERQSQVKFTPSDDPTGSSQLGFNPHAREMFNAARCDDQGIDTWRI
jgi:hypothetical protein